MIVFEELVQTIITGVSVGCIYAIIALGLVMLFKATEVFSFVHGEIMMLGAFIAFSAITFFSVPYVVAFLAAVVFSAVLGILVERITIRPLIGEPVFTIAILTIGLGYIFRAVTSMIPQWGTDTYGFQTPFSGENLRKGELVIAQDHLFIIVSTVLLILVLAGFFRFTKMGIAMRATSQNQLAAVYMGISVNRVFSSTWAITAVLGGIAGVLVSPITFVHMGMGLFVIKAFPAAVLGGFSSIPGAIVGGLIIGIVESLSGFYLPEGWKDITAWIILILILLIRPQGLFGIQEKKKV
ncbi:MAG: branched-chain amino acid ABC transporter permease [Proteobacteria bacterium]|nr:branched-chain amino acid ABC transporter permease [Pseudomonadota bacterium]